MTGATFRLPSALDSARREFFRNTLYDVGSAELKAATKERSRTLFVDFPQANVLRIAFESHRIPRTQELTRNIAAGYLAHLEREQERLSQTPSDREVTLVEQIGRLESAICEQDRALADALARVPPNDHRADRDQLLRRWRSLRTLYHTGRTRLAEIAESVERLRTSPPPSHGVVSAERRERAFANDPGLQQDLRELSVTLAEVRAQIIEVREQTNVLRSHLDEAATRFYEASLMVDPSAFAASKRDIITRIAGKADEFRLTTSGFLATCDQELSGLKGLRIDPRSPELLERYERIRSALAALSYEAAKILTKIRDDVAHLDDDADQLGGLAQNVFGKSPFGAAPVRQRSRTGQNPLPHGHDSVPGNPFPTRSQIPTSITRGFQTVQRLYHRFEFAAGLFERSQNFRLDAALRSASGLQRRSRQRMQQIDQKLQHEALQEMRTARAAALRRAEDLLERTRREHDRNVAELMTLDEQIASRVGSVEEFVAAVAGAEMAAQNVEVLRSALEEAKATLAVIQSRRKSHKTGAQVELITAGVLGPPINHARRLRSGATGGAITLAALLLGQWWIARRT